MRIVLEKLEFFFFFEKRKIRHLTKRQCIVRAWTMLNPNVREIWHFKSQKTMHQGTLMPSIANFFAIVLQCNSTFRIAL